MNQGATCEKRAKNTLRVEKGGRKEESQMMGPSLLSICWLCCHQGSCSGSGPTVRIGGYPERCALFKPRPAPPLNPSLCGTSNADHGWEASLPLLPVRTMLQLVRWTMGTKEMAKTERESTSHHGPPIILASERVSRESKPNRVVY